LRKACQNVESTILPFSFLLFTFALAVARINEGPLGENQGDFGGNRGISGGKTDKKKEDSNSKPSECSVAKKDWWLTKKCKTKPIYQRQKMTLTSG
jgi:hypothetical protein